MITWGKFIVAVLTLITSIVTMLQRKNLIQQGEDQAIARATAELLKQTQAAKAIMEEVYAMDEAQVDELLRSLEGDPPTSRS